MATYLLTVQQVERTSQGLRLAPGLIPSQTRDRPAIGTMMPGASLELRCPDGTKRPTRLVTFGIAVEQREDGSLFTPDDLTDPVIKLMLPGDLSPADIPPGTEVWLADAGDGDTESTGF